jgi:hypothetical protein
VPKSSGANIAASSPQPTTLAKAITASTVINPNEYRISDLPGSVSAVM